MTNVPRNHHEYSLATYLLLANGIALVLLTLFLLASCNLPGASPTLTPQPSLHVSAMPTQAVVTVIAEVTASAPAIPPAQLLARQGRGRPNQAIFSGDSEFILVAYDSEITVFPAGETREAASLAPPAKITALALFDEDRQLALASASGQVSFARFDPANGQITAQKSAPVETGYTDPLILTVSPNGKYLSISTWEKAQVWDIETGQPLLAEPLALAAPAKLARPAAGYPTLQPAFKLQFSPDSKYLLVSRFLGENSILLELPSGKTVKTFDCAAHLLGGEFVVCENRGFVDSGIHYTLTSLTNLSQTRPIKLDSEYNGLVFSPDASLVSLTEWDQKQVRVFKTLTGEQVYKYRPSDSNFRGLSYFLSNSGQQVALLSDYGERQPHLQPYIIKPNSETAPQGIVFPEKLKYDNDPKEGGQPIPLFSPKGDAFLVKSGAILTFASLNSLKTASLSGDSGAPIHTLALSPDGKTLAVGQGNFTVTLFDIQNGLSTIQTLPLSGAGSPSRWLTGVTGLGYAPDGKTLAAATSAGSLGFFSAEGSPLGAEINPNDGPVEIFGLVYAPDNKSLLTGGYENAVRRWENLASPESSPIMDESSEITRLAYAPDGGLFATGSAKGIIRLANTNGLIQHTLNGHTSWVTGLAFSPDGSLLASAALDGFLRLWQVADGKESLALNTGAPIVSLAFDPRGEFVAVGTNSGVTRLWGLKESRWLGSLPGGGVMRALAFSPDGERLATGSESGQLQLWQVRLDGTLLVFPTDNPPIEAACQPNETQVEITASIPVGAAARLTWHIPYNRDGNCAAFLQSSLRQVTSLPEIVTSAAISAYPAHVDYETSYLQVTADIRPSAEGAFDYTWEISANGRAIILEAKLSVIQPAESLALPSPLYFVSETGALTRLERDGRTQTVIVPALVTCMDVSLGGKLAYLQNDALYVAEADGSNPRLVQQVAGCPAWSPDGNLLAFPLNGLRVTDLRLEQNNTRLLREDLHQYGKTARRYLAALAWSPFSNNLVALAGGWDGASHVLFDVNTGGRLVLGTHLLRYDVNSISWSRDGYYIYSANPDYNCYYGAPPFITRTDIRQNQPFNLLGGSDVDLRGGFAPFETDDGRLLALVSQLTGTPCDDDFPPISLIPAGMSLATPGVWKTDPDPSHTISDPREALWQQDGNLVIVRLGDGSIYTVFPFSPDPNALLPIRGSNLRWGQ